MKAVCGVSAAPTYSPGSSFAAGRRMVSVVLIATLVLLAGGGYWWRASRVKAPHATLRDTDVARRFGAVEIRIRNGACEAACVLEGQRFLAKDAPALPLPACDVPQCACTFVKLSDRRTDDRRWLHGDASAAMFLTKNRRGKRGRREVD